MLRRCVLSAEVTKAYKRDQCEAEEAQSHSPIPLEGDISHLDHGRGEMICTPGSSSIDAGVAGFLLNLGPSTGSSMNWMR
jgi:hypothetical protein